LISSHQDKESMVTVNLFAIVAILTVCLLGISPAASAEEAGGKVYELKNEPWNLSIQPSTLEVIARVQADPGASPELKREVLFRRAAAYCLAK